MQYFTEYFRNKSLKPFGHHNNLMRAFVNVDAEVLRDQLTCSVSKWRSRQSPEPHLFIILILPLSSQD